MIRIFLVDDHPIVLEGIRGRLSQVEDIRIVGEARDGREALARIPGARPDVVLMDLNMPELDGFQVAERLREKAPSCRVLVLTMHDDREYVLAMARAGVKGYLLKDCSPAELIEAIHLVHAGGTYLSPAVSRMLASEYLREKTETGPRASDGASGRPRLSRREREVLGLVAEGLGNRESAERLGLSVRTVESHRQRLMKKLEARNAAELVKVALTAGLIKA